MRAAFDDKTVVKLMGAIIKQIGVFLEGRDIIDTVNREMQANSRKISEKGIMKNLIQKTKNRDAQLYVEENEEIQKDYYQGEFDQDVDWLDAANPEGEDYQQDKLYRQMEKNALLIQKQQQVQMELQRQNNQYFLFQNYLI
ncbi:hypothetical protein PPERSA_11256 [Pseudocohnilembus persalinus]|uniref:Uncharacterized protein n=1 Tax=Pseudocohnilembus persalinus TaxID=266149 RepID=A0A0V0QZS3_PSEPJ|nr:hypothetical protein PPERSA_11256 [Pseudocohnilembus persalinus]|eukprot:KRX07707.1 hypothetical protein PPERSA_11256 [Pseudocohnilembus persalinus]